MSDMVNLEITKDEAIFLNSGLNALKTIMLHGTSENKEIEKQVKNDTITLQQIQSKIPKFI